MSNKPPMNAPPLRPANVPAAVSTSTRDAVSHDAEASEHDPMIITGVTFLRTVTIGGYGHEGWSVQGTQQNQYHGKSRVERCPEGVRIIFKAGKQYEERTVFASAICDICEMPMSSLDEANRKTWERMQREVRR